MKKRIMLEAVWGSNWIGGVYYVRNMCFSLMKNAYINENYEIFIHTLPENRKLFIPMVNPDHVVCTEGYRGLSAGFQKKSIYRKFGIDIMFPLLERVYIPSKVKEIAWIPDFQHLYYPDFFSSKDYNSRENKYNSFVDDKYPLVLSSNAALTDFMGHYSSTKEKVFVIPFVSYIEDMIRSCNDDYSTRVLEKYRIAKGKYAVIMNQFWKHKNHVVVFEAIKKYYYEHMDDQFVFVFTGKVEDYRDKEYSKKIKQMIKDPIVKTHTKILGFIDRKEQIAIMKNAEYVIQPSLFEGWGTVLEDSKVLDKTVLLSDIPVHHEQMTEKCILFNPNDHEQLARLIEQENKKEHKDNINKGIMQMHKRSYQYSEKFEKMLRELEV